MSIKQKGPNGSMDSLENVGQQRIAVIPMGEYLELIEDRKELDKLKADLLRMKEEKMDLHTAEAWARKKQLEYYDWLKRMDMWDPSHGTDMPTLDLDTQIELDKFISGYLEKYKIGSKMSLDKWNAKRNKDHNA